MFVLSDKEELRALVDALSSAGFEVEVVTERLEGSYADAAHALAWTLAWPDYGETVQALSGPDRSRFTTRALAAAADKDPHWWFAINYFCARTRSDR